MPARLLTPTAEASFLAYLSYLEDLAGVLGGRYGLGIDGVYLSLQLHPPLRALPPSPPDAERTGRIYAGLVQTWSHLSALAGAADEADYHRQANAVAPMLAQQAVVTAAAALAVAWGEDDVTDDEAALSFLSDRVLDGLFPYPWSAYCAGCPQVGDVRWGGSALPAAFVSVFSLPDPGSSDARLAMLLRTTRTRLLDERFALERQTDVRPGRSRRNLSRDVKAAIGEGLAPTTVFDVFERLRRRVERDDGEAFTEAPFDDVEARRFAVATSIVADSTAAAIEAVVAHVIGWDLFTDLVGGAVRRAPQTARAVQRRSRALSRVGASGYSRLRSSDGKQDE